MSSTTLANNAKAYSNMGAPKDTKAAATKMHRRSRTGCFTCRLRRKKCDEGKPSCRACKHLGLKCEYKRPMWWSNSETRRKNKEDIKEIIKSTQNAKKNAQTPPSLCHSVQTSETYSDSKPHSRARSVSTPFSSECAFPHIPTDGYFAIPPLDPSMPHSQYPMFSPYEVDIKTERQIFVNDVPTQRDSIISTFSTFQPPPLPDAITGYSADSWVQQESFEMQQESFIEEPVDLDFFQLPHGQVTPTHETIIDLDERDRPLLNHFIDKVAKLIFPILDANQLGSARSDIILPALEQNKCYLHCCLSISAVHMRSTDARGGEQLNEDIMRHRYAAIQELCEALNRDVEHGKILEATLGMIFFQCSVGRPNDSLPDIPWHQHFQAATNLAQQKLELPADLVALAKSNTPYHPPFNMTLTAWIDILGSTMLGRSPVFADTYRELNIAKCGAGLAELMGCDDHIMFLISEIACLEARKLEGMEEVMLCKYIEILGNEISLSEVPAGSIKSAISATGAIRPTQLKINMTSAFRLAARIYLCTMVPGFNIGQQSITNLVAAFVEVMDFIPAGIEGFDRALIWPLLVAGSVSLPNSPFRIMFVERCVRLGEAANFGSFGRIRELFKDIWKVNEAGFIAGDYQSVHWRDVMQQKEWDSLLI